MGPLGRSRAGVACGVARRSRCAGRVGGEGRLGVVVLSVAARGGLFLLLGDNGELLLIEGQTEHWSRALRASGST